MTDQELMAIPKIRPEDAARYLQDGTTAQEIRVKAQNDICPFCSAEKRTPGSRRYPLCEFMYSHFQLFNCQPVIFCNVLDPAAMKEDVGTKEHDVSEHKVRLPLAAMSGTVAVTAGGAKLTGDEDYTVYYDDRTDACVVELLETGSAYDEIGRAHV